MRKINEMKREYQKKAVWGKLKKHKGGVSKVSY